MKKISKSQTMKVPVCHAKELESILEALGHHKESEVKSDMEKMCLHFRAVSPPTEDQGSPKCFLPIMYHINACT